MSIEIFKVRDKSEKNYIKKGDMFDLPMRLLVVGKSFLSGKTNLLTNLLLQDDQRLYRNNFKGENIIVFSGSLGTDKKLDKIITQLDIPESNLFNEFDEDTLEALLDITKENYDDAISEGEKPQHTLFILDDMSFGGNLKKHTNGSIAKLFSNGRHYLASCYLSSQRYVDVLTSCRENCSGVILFKCTDRQLDTIAEDHNFLVEGKNQFKKMFREVTTEPHSFMVVNYSNNPDKLYMNKNFKAIGPCGKVKGEDCGCP
jgi:hypothetical protein